MNPEFLRAMADMLENPDKLRQQAERAEVRLHELVDKFEQEDSQVNEEDLGALVYGLSLVVASQSGIFEQMNVLSVLVQMAHWLGKKEGRSLGYKQARAEQLFRPVRLREEEK